VLTARDREAEAAAQALDELGDVLALQSMYRSHRFSRGDEVEQHTGRVDVVNNLRSG
jgi:hypothetical protein